MNMFVGLVSGLLLVTLSAAVQDTKLCSLPASPGICEALVPSWYYDAAEQTCKQFDYGGCGGNANRFDSLEDCTDTCGGKDDECLEVSCEAVTCGPGDECAVVHPECLTTPCCPESVCRPTPNEACPPATCELVKCGVGTTCQIVPPTCEREGPPCCHKAACLKQECPSICPLHYKPVCGSDGKTYGNTCQLGVAACLSSGAVTLANNGTCTTNNCGRGCNKIYKPVCGSNGVTYNNKCLLEKAACHTATNITLATYGGCTDPRITVCPPVVPVCSPDCPSDSTCKIEQPSCKQPPCCQIATCVKRECPTICPFNYEPVCGSDGKTYGNTCQLGVAACLSNGAVTLASNGTCATNCYAGLASDYNGTLSVTASGKTCQRWDVEQPHLPKPWAADPTNHPDADVHNNYCRNPDPNDNKLWCYTTDPQQRWEYCDLHKCRVTLH